MALEHPLSFQLYSARNFPPLEDQLATLADLGYTNVEPFGPLYADPAGFKAALDTHGLVAESGHFALDLLENDFAKALAIAEAIGTRLVVAPYLVPDARPTDVAGWQALGGRLSAVAEKLAAEGLAFAWHNHDFEFLPLADGSLPIVHLLADPAVKLELDVAWVVRAGADPKAWIPHFDGRIAAVHVKDVAPAGEKADEGGWADVGTGIVPWGEIWPMVVAAGATLAIAEHDNPSDWRRFASASAAAMKALAR